MGPEVDIVRGEPGAPAQIDVLLAEERVPWSGITAQHAMPEVYAEIKAARTTLIFVNTRWQAEFAFQELWRLNEDALPIALHHGSLAPEQRRKVEAAMARGELRAVVATSTLDLGIDWGAVDLVIQLSAPKGASRLVQRIGRANHRLDEPSRALLTPANRFEMLECQAAREAVAEGALDGETARAGALDVLAQHVMGAACGEPFDAAALHAEVATAAPYADISRETFDRVVEFVSTGGYALKVYDRFKRIVRGSGRALARAQRPDRPAPSHERGRHPCGQHAEHPRGRRPGPSGPEDRRGRGVLFRADQRGRHLCLRRPGLALRGRHRGGRDRLPRQGQRAPDPQLGRQQVRALHLSGRPRTPHDRRRGRLDPPSGRRAGVAARPEAALHDPARGRAAGGDLPRGNRHYLVCYAFDGRLSHTTLAMLLARRLDRAGVGPLGYVCNDYAVAIWSMRPYDSLDMDELFQEDMLGDDLEAWLDESYLMKRAFRQCATISGLIERRFPGAEKTGRQVTFSTDLIYDVLRRHQPDHLLLQAARKDAATESLDILRLGRLLRTIQGRIRHLCPAQAHPLRRPAHAGDRAREDRRRRLGPDPGRSGRGPDRGRHVVSWRFAAALRAQRAAEPLVPPDFSWSCGEEGELCLSLHGTAVRMRRSGALWVERPRTLVAGDLHLEKGSSYGARGQLLPPYDTRATLDRLEAEVAATDPRTIVLLGDSFHDRAAESRLDAADAEQLRTLAYGRTLMWVTGNHDPCPPPPCPAKAPQRSSWRV
jgi:ATP-dependent Lhr-like helicase